MADFINKQLLQFLSFLKNPKDEVPLPTTIASKFKIVLSFFLLEIPVMLVLILIIGGLENAKLINTDNHSIETLLKTVPTTALFFLVIIIAPLFEELIFRLYLRYETNLLIGASIRFSYLFFDREKAAQFDLAMNSKWSWFYPKIFYFSALLFGLVHLVNFEITPAILLLSPIIVAPQIVLGLVIGYLRVRHGFWTGFMMHAFHNFVFVGISVIAFKTNPDLEKKKISQQRIIEWNSSQACIVYNSCKLEKVFQLKKYNQEQF